MGKHRKSSSKKVTNRKSARQTAITKATSKAKAVAVQMEAKKLSGANKSRVPTVQKEAIVSDETPFPTDNNGNSHGSQKINSNSAVANKLDVSTNLTNPTNPVEVNDEAPFPTEDNGNSHKTSFLTIATNLAQKTVKEKLRTTSFHTLRNLLHKPSILDNGTVIPTNKATSIRVSVMCAVPVKDVDEDEAPLVAIRKMNGMLKSLMNKIPSVKIGLWNPDSSSKNTYLKELPENVDTVEKYVYDYNRFLSPGKNLYCRIKLVYNPNKTSSSEIESVISTFRKPRVQHMIVSHSDALSPVQMGTLTGSVRAMAESSDFKNSFKAYFKLKSLGMWWACPKADLSWTKDSKKWALHYELDRSDVEEGKNNDIISYFNKNSSLVDNNFFGTAMSVAPIFTPFLDDEVKMRITKLATKQQTIGANLRSITIGGTQILNWADSKMENTLHRQLMCVESIYDKTVVKSGRTNDNGKDKSTFKGRLFYAIIPNQKTKMTTFYFSQANCDEARGVARGLPLFIKDHFRLEPSYFCSSDAITSCLEGEWNYESRTFLTLEEKDEKDKFSNLLDNITGVKEVFISETQKAAMAMDGEDVGTVDTRLTKGDVAPTAADNISAAGLSTLTGETRESKAKAYAAEESLKVATQYIASIDDMKAAHESQIAALMEKLKAADLQKKLPASENPDEALSIPSTNEQQETIEIDLKDGADNMSGLSIDSDSSDSDNEPIMNSIKRKRRERKKKLVSNDIINSSISSPLRKINRVSSVTPGKGESCYKTPPSAVKGRRSPL